MALKPDRDIRHDDISKFFTGVATGATASPGGIAVATGSVVPSGAAMDQTNSTVGYHATGSGVKPLGLLLNEVVNQDLTRIKLNPYKSQAQTGDKVRLCVDGWVVTNMLDVPLATAITVGQLAYLGNSGTITNASGFGGGANDFLRERVGTFLTKADEDGYAKVNIDLPN